MYSESQFQIPVVPMVCLKNIKTGESIDRLVIKILGTMKTQSTKKLSTISIGKPQKMTKMDQMIITGVTSHKLMNLTWLTIGLQKKVNWRIIKITVRSNRSKETVNSTMMLANLSMIMRIVNTVMKRMISLLTEVMI